MALKVDPLKKEELFFELAFRGIAVSYSKTGVKEMKEKLRPLFEKEEKGEEGDYVDKVANTVEQELALCDFKIEEVDGMVDLGIVEDKDAKRSRALLSHLNRRVCRLYPIANDAAKDKVKDLLTKLKSVVVKFREVGEGSVYQASSIGPEKKMKIRNNEEKPKEIEDAEGGSENVVSEHSPRGRMPIDVHKWGIKFSGSDGGTSVLSFIADVEDKAQWRSIDLNCLVAAASEFFEGPAKTWYRSMRGKIDSWSEMKILLRKEYLPLDYYDTLWDEIRSRKQGSNESVGQYVANMIGLFEWLELGEAVAEEAKLAIIKKNLAPFFLEKLALTPIYSISELKEYGKQLEASKQRVDLYEGGKSKNKCIAPEFAYKATRKPTVNVIEVRDQPPSQPDKFICWKCQEPGHVFSSCDKKQQGKFCYRCGRAGETVVSCPVCSKVPRATRASKRATDSSNQGE